MIVVNLLPNWEEQEKKKSIIFWIFLSLISLFGLSFSLLGCQVFQDMSEDQMIRNYFIQSNLDELKHVSSEYDSIRDAIDFFEEKKNIIERLNKSRFYILSFMKELASSIPVGLYITEINYKPPLEFIDDELEMIEKNLPHWEFIGIAQNSSIISDLIKSFENSPFFSFRGLGNISSIMDANKISVFEKFTILVDLRHLQEDAEFSEKMKDE